MCCMFCSKQYCTNKETSHAFLHAFQEKHTLFRYRQVCLLCVRTQATRCTYLFFISTNCRRASPIRPNAPIHTKVKVHMHKLINNYFYLVVFGKLSQSWPNFKEASRKSRFNFLWLRSCLPCNSKYSELFHPRREYIFKPNLISICGSCPLLFGKKVSASVISMK